MFDMFKMDNGSITYPSKDKIHERLVLDMARDLDGKIREALIAMGWTPPPTNPSHRTGGVVMLVEIDAGTDVEHAVGRMLTLIDVLPVDVVQGNFNGITLRVYPNDTVEETMNRYEAKRAFEALYKDPTR